MSCCKKIVKKYKKVVVPVVETVTGYIEGQDGFVTVVYLGTTDVRVRGCKTSKRYLFGVDSVRVIDTNDAACLVSLMPVKWSIIDGVKSDSAPCQDESETSKSGVDTGDGQVHEISTEGVSGYRENVE